MAIEWTLHTHGPWNPEGEPLVYDKISGKYKYDSVRSKDAGNEEAIYLGGKKTVYNLIVAAVDEQLSISAKYKNELIDAMASSWLSRTNMQVFKNHAVASLKIHTEPGHGLEARTDGTIHYWNNGVYVRDATTMLKNQIKIIVQKVYSSVSDITDPDRAIRAARQMLSDVMDQFGVKVT